MDRSHEETFCDEEVNKRFSSFPWFLNSTSGEYSKYLRRTNVSGIFVANNTHVKLYQKTTPVKLNNTEKILFQTFTNKRLQQF